MYKSIDIECTADLALPLAARELRALHCQAYRDPRLPGRRGLRAGVWVQERG